MTSDTTQTAAPAPPDTLGQFLFGLAVLTLALTPTQMTFTVKHLELTPAELVLILIPADQGPRGDGAVR